MDSILKNLKLTSHSPSHPSNLPLQSPSKPKMHPKLLSKSKGLVIFPKELNNELYQILKARLNSHTQILIKEFSFSFVLSNPKQTFKPVLKLLKNEKCLLSLKSNLSLENNHELNQAISTIKSSPHSRTLSLQIDSRDMSSQSFQSFTVKLRALKNISDLSIDFLEPHKISAKGFQILFSSLLSMRSLSKLSLGFRFSDKIQDIDLRIISSKLNLFNLHGLSLNFAHCKRISDKGIEDLSRALSKMKNLQSLEVDLSHIDQQISNEGVIGLFNGLSQAEGLRSLALNLDYSELTKSSGHEPLSVGLMQLNVLNIRRLSLKCYKYFSDRDSLKILESLGNFSQLKSLSLGMDCSYYQLSGQGFRKYFSALTCFTSLSSLTLDFSTCLKLENETIEALAEGISQCVNLSQISLNFSQCRNIIDAGVERLALSFEGLKLLSQVCLDFSTCERITDSSVKVLAGRLGSIENLNYLQLVLFRCKSITNNAVQNIAMMLRRLEKLEHLHLTLAFCKQVNDEAIQTLAMNLKYLRSLNSLILNFRHCEVGNGRGIQNFFGMLENMKGLKSITLHFPSCAEEQELKNRLLQVLRSTKIYITFHEI